MTLVYQKVQNGTQVVRVSLCVDIFFIDLYII